MEDCRIVDLYLERNEEAIKETSSKYGARLRRLSYGITEDHQESEECENSTYLQAWNLIPPNDPRSYLYAFLAKITRHLSLNVIREKKALKRNAQVLELSLELEQCIPAPDDSESRIDSIVFSEMINGFLSGLDLEKRSIFVLRYWHLKSISDISKSLDISQSKVKTTLYRLRESLRQYIEREGYTL